METFGIKSWAEADRPIEKLISSGRHTLTDSELLAIMIRSGSRDESAVDLARRILALAENDLSKLAKMSLAELSRFKGMGSVKAASIIAALELGKRRKTNVPVLRNKIGSSREVADLFFPLLSDLPHEEFWLLLLNRANQVITKQNLSKGGISGTVVDPKMVFKIALDAMASGIILCHNHPSGNNKPSETDIKLTKKLKSAGDLLDISVLDHIIIANDKYYSFADEGMM